MKNMENTFAISILRDVTPPNRGTEFSAGLDFYIPNDLTETELRECYTKVGGDFNESINNHSKQLDSDILESFTIQPNHSILIPTGVKVNIPHNHILKFENKSGVASKKGLLVGACVIDEDYQGVVHINLWNVSSKPVTLNAGEKIVQAILYPVSLANPINKPIEELYKSTTERGEGGFGSTGTN